MKTKYMLLISVLLIFSACEKQQVFDNADVANKTLKSLVSTTIKSNENVGGTIGCTIRFYEDHSTDNFGKLDNLESCEDDEFHTAGAFPPKGDSRKLYPEWISGQINCISCDLRLVNQIYMDEYWTILHASNIQNPTQSDYDNARVIVAPYADIILAVYYDPNSGDLLIPASSTARRNMLIAYLDANPQPNIVRDDMISYVDLVYRSKFYLTHKIIGNVYEVFDPVTGMITNTAYGILIANGVQ